MEKPAPTVTIALSLGLAALMVVQSAGGLLFPAMYRDEVWILAAWFGNDLVTLLVAVPLLLTGLTLARRGSLRGELVWLAALGYGVYNYAFYVFGARMNIFFPLYILLFAGSAFALILGLSRLDPGRVAQDFSLTTPVRMISGYMLLTGTGLGVAWLAQWAAFIFRGVEPGSGEEPFTLIAGISPVEGRQRSNRDDRPRPSSRLSADLTGRGRVASRRAGCAAPTFSGRGHAARDPVLFSR